MTSRTHFIEERIQAIKLEILALGDLRPGTLSMQYNICGNPSCRCKATPPIKHGPYSQVSFSWRGKSTTQFVRDTDVAEVRHQLDNYHQLRTLVDEWIGLALELSRIRIHERHAADAVQNSGKSEQLRQRTKRASRQPRRKNNDN